MRVEEISQALKAFKEKYPDFIFKVSSDSNMNLHINVSRNVSSSIKLKDEHDLSYLNHTLEYVVQTLIKMTREDAIDKLIQTDLQLESVSNDPKLNLDVVVANDLQTDGIVILGVEGLAKYHKLQHTDFVDVYAFLLHKKLQPNVDKFVRASKKLYQNE